MVEFVLFSIFVSFNLVSLASFENPLSLNSINFHILTSTAFLLQILNALHFDSNIYTYIDLADRYFIK